MRLPTCVSQDMLQVTPVLPSNCIANANRLLLDTTGIISAPLLSDEQTADKDRLLPDNAELTSVLHLTELTADDTGWLCLSEVTACDDTGWLCLSEVTACDDTGWLCLSEVTACDDTGWLCLSEVTACDETDWLCLSEVTACDDTGWLCLSEVTDV